MDDKARTMPDKAVEGLITMALTSRPVRPVTDDEIETFLCEYDAGKHPLTKADRAALNKSQPDLLRKIKDIIRGPKA